MIDDYRIKPQTDRQVVRGLLVDRSINIVSLRELLVRPMLCTFFIADYLILFQGSDTLQIVILGAQLVIYPLAYSLIGSSWRLF